METILQTKDGAYLVHADVTELWADFEHGKKLREATIEKFLRYLNILNVEITPIEDISIDMSVHNKTLLEFYYRYGYSPRVYKIYMDAKRERRIMNHPVPEPLQRDIFFEEPFPDMEEDVEDDDND